VVIIQALTPLKQEIRVTFSRYLAPAAAPLQACAEGGEADTRTRKAAVRPER
jgi:hypothetical protein